ncbi:MULTISPECIES: thiol reductant ABC exporter subunit CydD [unclassified Exiguobacterium]|uniref:thiol reductant ABC exporter subunit CydD n=1 Tax=unclassified Exiguobacterium TaxID=2644629 RepID=UPI001040059F|nr:MULTISPECIES: thiol reductant ABC exporter subunit CydD [unclassified Exiguobacterium]TCI24222.1 thiol reductant ABC exporter subunit CydD [Exiguobacterium sp. SH5S4]TCI48528.1 thiol reductant ABC exporter subunit CydD [Exiguobacterium sp. SH5S32]TCI51346.1 thiol reductant ABC exporter subunit CydD [Exiguobacterium sp. SH5S13]TCI55415.1 thiol reductant ABC exporter subunit CydD [Exiguobacterium sp. SH1S4]TCI63428.1 thiol reductant ABC exporter subunit CydD [Exiguobacterium sp. SH0S2]
MNAVKRLQALALAEKGHIVGLVIAAVMIGLSILAQAYLIVDVVDRVFLKNESFQSVIPSLGWLVLALLARALFGYVSGRIGANLSERAKRTLRRQLLDRYTSNPIETSLSGQSGKKVSVYMDAVDEVDAYFSQYWPQVIQTSIIPLLILVVVFSQHWISGVIMMVTAPFIPIFFIIIGIATQKKSEEQMEKMNQFSGKFLDVLQGLTTLKLYGRAEQEAQAIEKSSLDFRDATMVVLKTAFLSGLMLEFISMLSTGVVALEVALQMVVWQNLTFFAGFLILVLAPEYYLAIKDLGSAFHTGRGSMGAADRIFEALDAPDDRIEWGDRPLTNRTPELVLDAVSFQYEGGRFTLHPLSGVIPARSHVALVGASGSGKTTVLNVLSGLVKPDSGRVLVDGEPLESFTDTSWYGTIGYISQNPYLFAGSLAANIALGETADETDIMRAAEAAGLVEVIANLPDGLNTELGEGGYGLSGGERQRLALARAFLKRPGIILFDEPTTGLDLVTERIVRRSIEELSRDATLVTVAHRLHTIKQADAIWFMDEGNLVANGTHEQLLAVPAYADLFTLQKGVRG